MVVLNRHIVNLKSNTVCEQVIQVAASLISATEIPLNQLLHFISTIPREFTDYFGPLRVVVQKWFVPKKECSAGNSLLSNLIDFPATFVKKRQDEGLNVFDDEDVGAWEAEARRWARTLLLVTSEERHLERIFWFLEAYGNKLSEKCPSAEFTPIKFFIIVLSFIEELEVRQKKHGCQNTTIFRGCNDLSEKLVESLSLVLENMVVVGKLSCSVFWSRNTENRDLPYSIKGKLGGPSQRRLTTSITSSVLQAVCEILEDDAIIAKIGNSDCEPWVVASWLRDHLLVPRERKNAFLWKKVEELILEDSRIDQYPKVIKGESKVVYEWQASGSLSAKTKKGQGARVKPGIGAGTVKLAQETDACLG